MSNPAVPADVLLGWLDHDPARLERHLSEYPEDTERLDLLTRVPELAAWLTEALVVPDGLAQQIRSTVQGNPSRREAGRVLGDLLGISWQTAALLWSDEELS